MYNINGKYVVEDLQYAYPFSPNGNYIQTSKIFKYSFKQGEAIYIPFQLNPRYAGYPIQISLYTSNYEPILTKTVILDDDSYIYFELSEDEVSILQPEIYYCGINLILTQNKEAQTTEILAPNCCIIQIYSM